MKPSIAEIIRAAGSGSRTHVRGLGRALPWFAARLAEARNQPVCVVAAEEEQAAMLARDAGLFTSLPCLHYPGFEIPPYTPLEPDPATAAQRIAVLYRLRGEGGPMVLCLSVEALARRVMPWSVTGDHCELLIAGEDCDFQGLPDFLVRAGYESSSLVRREGDFAVRGGIIDVYPPAAGTGPSAPLRLDFFGDTLESIRLFDPQTQRSFEEIEEVVLLPASDILFSPDSPAVVERRLEEAAARHGWSGSAWEGLATAIREGRRLPGMEFFLPLLYGRDLEDLPAYLPEGSLVLLDDPLALGRRLDLVRERIEANHAEALSRGLPALPPEDLFLDGEGPEDLVGGHSLVLLHELTDLGEDQVLEAACGNHALLRQEITLERRRRGLLAPLADRLVQWRERGERMALCCRSARQAERFAGMLEDYGLQCAPLAAPLREGDMVPGLVHLAEQPLSRGFDLPGEGLHLLSAQELFGERRLPGAPRRGQASREAEPVRLDELGDGDLVVHREHGIGLYRGLVNMEVGGARRDLMRIEYRDGDLLYVPVDRLHWVSRYQGLAETAPRLDRLGSGRWQSTKQKVTDAVWKVAHELLDIYARRALETRAPYSRGGELFRELEESFPFEETPDQARAIADVLNDLRGERPMDRLVCGDVGYGKTEVAVRAAFKVIEDGFQAALLAPTTVLAEQHAATFRDRFAGFPVTVRCLDRFRTSREQREIIAGLADGSVDMVIGTHRLLSRDVAFARLGLLIVDEEHRFGVSHKEKIKKLRAGVDVLTLTATPIPRTLQMSLLGIRDLSVISSPPRRRQPVKTFLSAYDPLVIREAISRELARGGQVFFVHNRVRGIARVAAEIQELAPGARVGTAHGQMPGAELERIMVDFIRHQVDILVCTTIIESGLDIPNANTILINRADRFGLADIYQLRGRVGRSSRQSYAYLLVPDMNALTRDARERLRALMDASDLGSGFKLAMNDLQLRGGGNLLGVSQSGHISAVGYDLYLELLQETVADLKARSGGEAAARPRIDPEVTLSLEAHIPESYMADAAQRYHAYRRIAQAGAGEPAEVEDLRDELIDRYGPLPRPVDNLLAVAALKPLLAGLGVSRVEQGPAAVVFTFDTATPLDPAAVLALVEENPPARGRGRRRGTRADSGLSLRLTPDSRLVATLPDGAGAEGVFALIRQVCARLQALSGSGAAGQVQAEEKEEGPEHGQGRAPHRRFHGVVEIDHAQAAQRDDQVDHGHEDE